jgi:hypothetical protein
MATTTYTYQLSKGKGLERILYFSGLGYNLSVHPSLYGDPILTSQAFYYLKDLDAVASLRIEHPKPQLNENQIEYLIDNYLVEYSTTAIDSKLTSKVMDYSFWRNDIHQIYHNYDNQNTGALIIDALNDESILSIETIDEEDKNLDLKSDWLISNHFTEPIIDEYLRKMHKLLNKKIMLQMLPTDERDGYFGKKRIFDIDKSLIDLYQAKELDKISYIDGTQDEFILSSSFGSEYNISLPITKINCQNLYNPLLLSYYFSGFNDKNPLNSFLGYYNVLEYYFEEAPTILGVTANNERKQLESVISLIVNHTIIKTYLENQHTEFISRISENIITSSTINISALDINSSNLVESLSEFLYNIRCATVHSKKTRKGQPTAIIKPYSSEANNMKIVLPIIHWLAILCIKKDYDLGNGLTKI